MSHTSESRTSDTTPQNHRSVHALLYPVWNTDWSWDSSLGPPLCQDFFDSLFKCRRIHSGVFLDDDVCLLTGHKEEAIERGCTKVNHHCEGRRLFDHFIDSYLIHGEGRTQFVNPLLRKLSFPLVVQNIHVSGVLMGDELMTIRSPSLSQLKENIVRVASPISERFCRRCCVE